MDRFHAYLDLRDDRLWLKPNARFEDPFVYVPTGLRFDVPDPAFGGLRVLDVADGSPAQQAGLGAGDIIVKVDGIPTEHWNRRDWKAAVQQKVGNAFILTIRRTTSQTEVTLPLHDPLAPR